MSSFRHAHVATFVLGLATTLGASTLGCSSSDENKGPSPTDFTVSYRNEVRLPSDGEVLSAEKFASQLRASDPVHGIRCVAEESAAFKDVSAFLGGISWSHPVAILKDESYPPLYEGKPQLNYAEESAGAASDAAPARAPNIERPDLVGVQNGIAIFLSKQHGLLAVDARGPAPKLSCSMKLPGEPMNFFYKGNELVIVVNSKNGTNRSALLRYAFDGSAFRFVDSVRFDDQRVIDARLFDTTIVAYTSWSKHQEPVPVQPAPTPGETTVSGGGAAGAPAQSSAMRPGGYSSDHLGSKVLVVKWDEALGVDWEDSLLDDVAKQDPMEGVAPGTKYTAGQLVSEYKTYQSFVTASDRYLVVPRAVQQTRFSHYETYNYTVCTNYNPQWQQVQSCYVNYERRANPDYRAPDPATGDYACNGKTLADCIKQAAPVVSQYIYVPTGQTCNMVWQGRCEKYENRSETYPRFETEKATEMSIYRFEAGSFVKLDAQMGKLAAKTDAVTFEYTPLSIKGSVDNKNQIQFQNGHLYVFSDQALQTLSVAGNSIAYVNRLGVTASTESNPSIAFSNDRAMISSVSGYRNNTQYSQVGMIDLSVPSIPKTLNGFEMPGVSTQLILSDAGILGPGQVSFGGGTQMVRSLEKLTLFSRDAGNELDNLLLGTEYDTFESSYFGGQNDDQRIRLDDTSRLFTPYSGRHHADQYEPTAHRLNISRIEKGRLVSERSFQVSEEIIRTAGLDADRSLVFANSAAYLAIKSGADWRLDTLRELFVPFASYRLDDAGLYARIDRVGSKCRITTHQGAGGIFATENLAEAFTACGDTGNPVAYGKQLLFAQTLTGVVISDDGKTITQLGRDQVEPVLKSIAARRTYCWIETGKPGSRPIEYLDAIPGGIACAEQEDNAGGGAGVPSRTAQAD